MKQRALSVLTALLLTVVVTHAAENATQTAGPAAKPTLSTAQTGDQVVYTVQTPAETQHEMVLVPAGEFIMGADDKMPNQQPRHTTFLNPQCQDRCRV